MNVKTFAWCCILLMSILEAGAGGVKEEREKELMQIAYDLQRGILEKNPDAILKHVSKQGIYCVDDTIPYETVKKDIKEKGSWLHSVLFDEEIYSKKYKSLYRPISLQRYFLQAKNIQVKVDFYDVNGEVRLNWATIHYTNDNGIEWPNGLIEFHYIEKEGWRISNSLYRCG